MNHLLWYQTGWVTSSSSSLRRLSLFNLSAKTCFVILCSVIYHRCGINVIQTLSVEPEAFWAVVFVWCWFEQSELSRQLWSVVVWAERRFLTSNVSCSPLSPVVCLFSSQKMKMLENEYKCLLKINRDPPFNKSGTDPSHCVTLVTCSHILSHTWKHTDGGCTGVAGLFCSRSWDGWLCWDDTPAGSYASQNCPDYFSNFDPTGEQWEFCCDFW